MYLELRTTPRALPSSSLSKADYVSAILRAVAEFESAPGPGPGPGSRMRTRLILSIDRRNSLPEAREVVELAARFRGRGVVGVDLCGDPGRGGIGALRPAFEEANRLQLSSSPSDGFGVTLHFGEAEASGTDEELLMMLREWKPRRIGHVIHLSERVKSEIRGYPGGLGLELCLSCNVHAGMVKGGFECHHFGDWCRYFADPTRLVQIYTLLTVDRGQGK